MNRGSQIDNVQSFVRVIGDNDSLWKLLLGREVNHRVRGIGHVSEFKNDGSVNITHFTLGLYSYLYHKQRFIDEFCEIYPPLFLQEVLESIQIEQEAKKREAEKRLRLIAEHKDKEGRLEEERQKRVRREAERQTLFRRLKEYFERDFLNAYNFYQAECFEYISLDEFQAKKSNYVRSWIQHQLNLRDLPGLEQAAAIGAVEGHVQVVARAGQNYHFDQPSFIFTAALRHCTRRDVAVSF